MAKKFDKIDKFRTIVENSGVSFHEYFWTVVPKDVGEFIAEVNKHTKIYIFSGVIRNYFLSQLNSRDLDLVLDEDIDLSKFLKKDKFRKNGSVRNTV